MAVKAQDILGGCTFHLCNKQRLVQLQHVLSLKSGLSVQDRRSARDVKDMVSLALAGEMCESVEDASLL